SSDVCSSDLGGTGDGVAGGSRDHGKEAGFPIRHEASEIVGAQQDGIHRMRGKVFIESVAGDRRRVLPARLQPLQIHRRRDAPEDAVGLIAERGLVDDGIEDLGLDLLLLAPVLRENMVDIDVFVEEYSLAERLAGAEVYCALSHQQRMDTL